MIPGALTFSESDAAVLRMRQVSYSSHSPTDSLPELQRYLNHYGFPELRNGSIEVEHTLSFHHWGGYGIAVHCWQQHEARGTVILVHGLFDHVGLYLELVGALLAEGYNVVGFDLPGHGLSGGVRASIGSFSEYKDVLSACVTWCAEEMAGPFHLVGQSTGCSAILYLFLKEDAAAGLIRQCVLLAPLVRARAWGRLTVAHSLFGWMISKVPRQFGANSHDTAFLRFLSCDDPLQARHIAVLWVSAMRRWVETFQSAPASERALLVIQGTGDTTVDWRWNLPAIRKKFLEAQTVYVKRAQHHLVNEAEPWRGEVYSALLDYLSQ